MSADISPVGEKGASEDESGGEDDGPKITTDEIVPYCSWWVVSSGCNSGQRKHLPYAVLKKSDGIPNNSNIEPPSRPLCDLKRDVTWMVKSHAVLPPGWVEDERICDRCADEFLGRDPKGVSEDAE